MVFAFLVINQVVNDGLRFQYSGFVLNAHSIQVVNIIPSAHMHAGINCDRTVWRVGKHEANAGLRLNVKVRYNIQEVGVVRAEPV